MSSATGVALVAASLASLAPGMLGEAGSVVGTHAAYARQDVVTPFWSMVVRVAVSGVGMAAAMVLVDGTAVLVVLGLAVSAGNIAGALQLGGVLRSQLPCSPERLWPSLARTGAAAALMGVPVFACCHYLASVGVGRLTVLAVSVVVGLVVFVGAQRACRAPELDELAAGARHLAGRP